VPSFSSEVNNVRDPAPAAAQNRDALFTIRQ
jgi:hypothetical protein